MKLDSGSPTLRQAIVTFLWEQEDLIVTRRPPGHDTRISIRYSFAASKLPGGVLVSAREKLPVGVDVKDDAAHQRKIDAAIGRFISKRSDLIMSKCPPGHSLVVKVTYEFVPVYTQIYVSVDYDDKATGGTMERWIAGQKRAKLEPSSEPFTDEHFDEILKLRLPEADRNFVEFFWWRNNEPASLEELGKSFRTLKRIGSLNKICFLQGLWLQCRQIRPDTCKFVVMQETRRTTKPSRRNRNFALLGLV